MSKCEICGTDTEFAPEASYYSSDGDGLTCSKECKGIYERRVADGMCSEFGHVPQCLHNREQRTAAATRPAQPAKGLLSRLFG